MKAECGILESDSPRGGGGEAGARAAARRAGSALAAGAAGAAGGCGGGAGGAGGVVHGLAAFLEWLAADGPAVLVFEDLHWADPALLSFLEHLADWAQGRAAAGAVHGAAGAVRAASGLGGGPSQRDHDQPAAVERAGDGPADRRRCWSGRCCPRRRSRQLLERARRQSAVCGGVRAPARPTAVEPGSRWTCRNRCRR